MNELKIIGHRGASSEAPENTIPAFDRALELKADGIEMDVRLSRDGVPVVIHDSDLRRTGGDARRVSELTREELRDIDVGIWFDEAFEGTEISDLESVVRRYRDRCLLKIELKCGTWRGARELAAAVAQVLTREGISPEQAVISSFNHAVLFHMRRLAVNYPRIILFSSRTRHWIARHPRFFGILAASGYDIPWSDVGVTITRAKLARWHRQGCRLAAWTVDQPETGEDLIDAGFDTVITNDPGAWITR